MSVVQVFLGRPRDLLPSIFPSISCICDVLCLIRCPRYCSFLVVYLLTISLPVPILLNTSSLVIFSVIVRCLSLKKKAGMFISARNHQNWHR